jgi:hypothetical protein
MSLIAMLLLLQSAPDSSAARWVIDVPVGLRAITPTSARGTSMEWSLALRVGKQQETTWLFDNGISGVDVAVGLSDMNRDGTSTVYVRRGAVLVEPRAYTGWQLRTPFASLALVGTVSATLGAGASWRSVYDDRKAALFGTGGVRTGFGAQAVLGAFVLRIDSGVGARLGRVHGETYATTSLGWIF